MEAVGAFWPEAHTDAKQMAELGAAGYKVFGFENARIPFCLTVEAEAFGCLVDLGKVDRTPMVKKHIYTAEDTPVYPEDFLEKGRARRSSGHQAAEEQYGDELPIVGHHQSPDHRWPPGRHREPVAHDDRDPVPFQVHQGGR